MTRDTLDQILRSLPVDVPDVDAPTLLHVLEEAAEAAPADAALRVALAEVHARDTATAGLRPILGGVQRNSLVRWDATTSTWEGTDVRTGRQALVRILRPAAARDPLLRRQLRRDARALAAVLPDVQFVDDDTPAIVLPARGPAYLHSPRGGHARPEALARLVAGTLAHLEQWEQAGLGVHVPTDAELRDAGDHLQLALLTPCAPTDAGPVLQHLAHTLHAWWRGAEDHPLADLLDGFAAAPPDRFSDAARATVDVLAELLAAVRHDVVRASRRSLGVMRRERLTRAIAHLDAALDPPAGLAAVGVDLEGRTMVVRSDGESVTWAAEGDPPEVVFDTEDGFDVPAARRLVRARGTAPVSDRLNLEVGGDPAFADHITRWVAAALELRTLRLLLEATEP